MDSFFGIGLMELFVIAVIALIVLGPERLPGAMRSVANFMRQIREIGGEFTSQFSEEIKMIEEMDPRRMINEVLDPSKTPAPSKTQPAKPLAQNTAKPLAQNSNKAVAPVKPPATQPASPAKTGGNETEQNTILPPAPQSTADQTPTDQTPTDQTPTDQTPTDQTPAEAAPAPAAPTTNAVPTEKAATDKAATDKAATPASASVGKADDSISDKTSSAAAEATR